MDGAAGAVKSWVALAWAIPPGLTVGGTVRIFLKPGFPPSFQDTRGPGGIYCPHSLGRGAPLTQALHAECPTARVPAGRRPVWATDALMCGGQTSC